jgi:transketolase C-terminal domain/subunit
LSKGGKIDADLAKANGTIGLRQKYPERAFDAGIAEQNMAGVAAGIASQVFIRKSGLIPRSSVPAQITQRLQKFGIKPDVISGR